MIDEIFKVEPIAQNTLKIGIIEIKFYFIDEINYTYIVNHINF